MEFTVKIELGNAEMQDGNDVALALTALAARVTVMDFAPRDFGVIKDLHGDRVGEWMVTA